MTQVQIVGAGMAGLLAAEMLRNYRPTVFERQASLPDNHGALLRFRTPKVMQETRQSFKRVHVTKALCDECNSLVTEPTLRHANMYASKVLGRVVPRSVMNLAPSERYIAPPDFLASLAEGANIVYGNTTALTTQSLHQLRGQRDIATISTVPMPVLMKEVGWYAGSGGFEWRPITSLTAYLEGMPIDVYQTIYYPCHDVPYYRASLTGNKLTIEFMGREADERAVDEVLWNFGLVGPEGRAVSVVEQQHKTQEYGKIVDIDPRVRQEFILAMTDEYNLYSVGRFATWRQILLDDVVHDVHVVHRMITERSGYARRLFSHSGGAT